MLCAIAKIDPASSERLAKLAKLTDSFGIPHRNVHGHITLATYIGDDEGQFILSCKAILSHYGKFSVYYDKIEVWNPSTIIVAVPRKEKTVVTIQKEISKAWAAYLDKWTQEDVWQPHTTLVTNPQADFDAIAEAMQGKWEPFAAQVDQIEFSRVYENGYEIIDFIKLI